MSTERQIAANRLNAQKSTGPKTERGKLRARRNAWRHGLTAETVVDILENATDYETFESQFKTDFQPQTIVEHELVARLASLLWRLRRATAIESGLLQIQTKIVRNRTGRVDSPEMGAKNKLSAFYDLIPSLGPSLQPDLELTLNSRSNESGSKQQAKRLPIEAVDVARSFLRLADVESSAFEKLGRYETRLWRQLCQTVFLMGQVRKLNSEPVFLRRELLGFVRGGRR